MEKKREHKFSRSHPVLASVLFAIGSLILTELLTHLVNFPIATLIPDTRPPKESPVFWFPVRLCSGYSGCGLNRSSRVSSAESLKPQ